MRMGAGATGWRPSRANPDQLDPEACAENWRAHFAGRPFSLWNAVRELGWVAQLAELRADSGGVEACTLPCPDVGFRFLIDPRPRSGGEGSSPADMSRAAEFRLAHEIGHTFFYRPGAPPTRAAPPTKAEERFCDAFATALCSTS
jgi:hypothetical protein